MRLFFLKDWDGSCMSHIEIVFCTKLSLVIVDVFKIKRLRLIFYTIEIGFLLDWDEFSIRLRLVFSKWDLRWTRCWSVLSQTSSIQLCYRSALFLIQNTLFLKSRRIYFSVKSARKYINKNQKQFLCTQFFIYVVAWRNY